jgi:thiosulfate/3-mercaptopyruvate sulfurtransferase
MSFGPVVSVDWLAEHLHEPDLVVVDVRWYLDGRSGRDAYDAGHLPVAVFVDLDTELSAPPSPEGGRHPLPEPAAFAAAMGRLGIGDATRVVAYDDTGGITAGRLWWMLDVLGRNGAVLDGGIGAWAGDLSTEAVEPEPTTFTAAAWPSGRLMTADDLEAALDSDLVLLDARSSDRYAHGAAVDPRPGHIPGARSAPATDNLVDGRLRTPEDLGDHYRALGTGERPVAAYCGSGVSACVDLLALRLAGLPDGRLFVGSWSAWGADENRPAEEGSDRS